MRSQSEILLHRLLRYAAAAGQSGRPRAAVVARLGIDGLANLVPACARCNNSKWHSRPAVEHVDRALARDRSMPRRAGWIPDLARRREKHVLDLSFSPWWIEYDGD